MRHVASTAPTLRFRGAGKSLSLGLAQAALLMIVGNASAQPYVEEARFQRSSPETSFIESTVALDGTTAVMTGTEVFLSPPPSRSAGAAFVFRKTNGQWALEQRLAAPLEIADNFGQAMDLRGDTLVVGGSANCATPLGRFHVFERTGTTWMLQRTYNEGDSARGADQCLGTSVSISGDTIAAGAPGVLTPSVHVARRVAGAWGNVEKIPGPQGRSGFGQGVDLSGDSMCVTSRNGVNTAQVDVFTRNGAGTWTLQQGIVTPASGVDSFDPVCSIDGDSLIVGAKSYDAGTTQNVGVAHVYVRNSGTWTLQQTLPGPGIANAGFGQSVSLLGDEVVVAASGAQVAYVYKRTGTTWSQTESIAKVTANSASTPATVGVSLSSTGLMVGQFFHSSGVYTRTTSPPGAPGAPTNVQATATGNTLNLTWGAPASGGAATSYTLLARTAAGAAPVATVPLGAVTSFAATAPSGTFLLSLTATNAVGTGPESAVTTVTFGGAVAPPASPTGLGVSVVGTTATFTWTAPVSGGPPAGYVLQAGLSPGFTSAIASLPLPVSPTTFSVR